MSDLLDPLFLIRTVGLIGVFAIVFIESGFFFGFFFPGDSLLFMAGLLASQGYFSLWLLTIGCFLAASIGGALGYMFGEQVGPAIFSREDSFFFHKKHIAEAQAFYEKHGRKTIVLARFLPIVRTFAPIIAGVGNMRYSTFATYNVIGSALWSFIFCFGGYFLGRAIPDAERYIIPIIIAIIVLSFLPTISAFVRRRLSR